MKLISFAMTTEQVRSRTKTVTRRTGWKDLQPGTLLQPVDRVRGFKPGQRPQKISGPIRVVSVRSERLDAITPEDLAKEGFPDLTVAAFVLRFCQANDCAPRRIVRRIEFEYVDGGRA